MVAILFYVGLFMLLCLESASAFVHHKHFLTVTPVAASCSSTRYPKFAPPLTSNFAGLDDNDSTFAETPIEDIVVEEQNVVSLSLLQSTQTIAYRGSLFVLTALISLQQLIPVLEEAGLSLSTANGEENAGLALWSTSLWTVLTLLFVPKSSLVSSGGDKASRITNLVDISALLAAIATGVAQTFPPVGLSALFLREIFYFGAAYKVEALIGLLSSFVSLFMTSSTIDGVLTLSLAVLLFGKAFEPLEEDWKPNNSEFLAENKLE